MSVGFPTDKSTVDNTCAQVAFSLRNDLIRGVQVATWLQSQTDANLQALGYSVDDIATLRGTFNAFNTLSQIANAQATQAQPNDFFFFARKLLGLN